MKIRNNRVRSSCVVVLEHPRLRIRLDNDMVRVPDPVLDAQLLQIPSQRIRTATQSFANDIRVAPWRRA